MNHYQAGGLIVVGQRNSLLGHPTFLYTIISSGVILERRFITQQAPYFKNIQGDRIQEELSNIPIEMFRISVRDFQRHVDLCLQAEVSHFEYYCLYSISDTLIMIEK